MSPVRFAAGGDRWHLTRAPVTAGEGQVVITLLRPEYPLVRFGAGLTERGSRTTRSAALRGSATRHS